MTAASMERRLQQLLDKQELYELVCAYCKIGRAHV